MQQIDGDAAARATRRRVPGFCLADDPTAEDRAGVAAFLCWRPADDDPFRAVARFDLLMDWFERHRHHLESGARRCRRLHAAAPTAA